MQKELAVASLGQRGLLLPAWVTAALRANDRLKLYLTLLQAASTHASHPQREAPDLGAEMRAAGVDGAWLLALVASARRADEALTFPDQPKLINALLDDLATMARPVMEITEASDPLHQRVAHWLDWLGGLPADRLSDARLAALIHGQRGGADSLHLLIMDLHKQINHLASELSSEVIDGAHVWHLHEDDRALVAAFMRGLNRTAALKFDHPGLDTAATRDGDRLLLQNDIGTNDAHVLVIQITGMTIALTYSDLHRVRFEFFAALLTPFGAHWSALESRASAALNGGEAYSVGTAHFDCVDTAALQTTLEGIGSRIVFLIDWNRARKRLQAFIGKQDAIAVLAEAARQDIGHRGWLQAGGERLIFAAMQAAGGGAFQIGDRLDEVMGAADARAFLLAVMRAACEALQHGQPPALVADETRMLLSRHVRHRTTEFDLLAEHAGYCHELAQAVSDALAHGIETAPKAVHQLATRAKSWERRADHLVMHAREQALRQPRWRPFAKLVEQSDDVADALEEAVFVITLIADDHAKGWNDAVRDALARLATTVLMATQDQVKALAIARTLGADSSVVDNDAFLAATWRILQAERQCDALLREARRVILGTLKDAASLTLANDLAATLELASDCLLVAAYGLRDVAFDTAGVL
ncbi:uncharacterized protein Yka (UPF0111/DUF47 family) [Actimicrobium sp. GrIS 1.19]|uniref:phosphate transport regulator n=1 Tax=Actimicrobium sp. GrIS 1.19 TaxID=3071708 RepID=UPI002E01A8B9|nr:uncharacterized protein Yka (UPF0111/DUF47 family) [Actimicrobium sp. GrIS 1.19]